MGLLGGENMKKASVIVLILAALFFTSCDDNLYKEVVVEATSSWVFYEDTGSWGEANLWAWSDSGDLFDGWPGEAFVDLGNGWFGYNYPGEWPVDNLNMIINGGGSQTSDLSFDPALPFYTGTATAPTAQSSFNGTSTALFVHNPNGWTPNAYIWDTANGDATLAGGWPGTAMTQIGDTDWYFISPDAASWPADTSGVKVIFNGTDGQTSDMDLDPSTPFFMMNVGDVTGTWEAN